MVIDKQHILDEIKRVAKANGGKVPGSERFENETGVKKSDWYPHCWLRWGDALREAGFSPNKFQTAYDQDTLLGKFVGLIRELRHFPYTEKFAASLNRTRRSRVILYSIVWVVNINLLG